MKHLYTSREASAMLGLSRSMLNKILARMKAPKLGSQYLIDEDTMDAIRRRRRTAGRPKGARNKPKGGTDGKH